MLVMNRITVKLTPRYSDILHTYDRASLSSRPPKNNRVALFDVTRFKPFKPRSTRIPTEQGALANTFFWLTNLKAGFVAFIPPSTVLLMEWDDYEGNPFILG
ncbi:unnamed protein product [Citrullus colocynthis]|uniref:Uncharacterized protein n=1 Tax=Citrullus colocynthis TaxID=252529 RepID=A0ABP0Y7B0_9ROSI